MASCTSFVAKSLTLVMILSDTIILSVLAGAGAIIATLARLSYNNLVKQVEDLRAELKAVRVEFDLLEKQNNELTKTNAALALEVREVEYCPVQDCHFRKLRALRKPQNAL